MKPAGANIDTDQIAPLHHQVYVVLRQQISEGVYPRDRSIPGEVELSKLFNVSRITIRRALERLKNEGLVSRRQGKGTFAETAIPTKPIRANLQGILENLLAMGLKTQVRVIEFGYVGASPDIAAEMQVAPGSLLQKAVRVRSYKDEPFSYLTTYVPEDIGRSYSQGDLSAQPLLALLERAGVMVSAADQTISARLADPIVAPLLGVETGAALLSVRRLVRDQTDRPVEHLQALYRPDAYEYQISMSRITKAKSKIWIPDATG